jgi:hypothetical protein
LAAGGSALRAEPGWRYFSELPSGWRAAFGVPGDSSPPGEGAPVVELFIRR